MSRRITLLSGLAIAGVAALAWRPAPAPAQPDRDERVDGEGDDEDGEGEASGAAADEGELDAEGIPAAYRNVELIDVTTHMRDDAFWSIELGQEGNIYVGTLEGRAYVSKDEGVTWAESIVMPESKPFYGFAGQYMFLGKLRADNAHRADHANLAPGWGSVGAQFGLAHIQDPSRVIPVEQEPIFGRGGSAGGLSTSLPDSYTPTGTVGEGPGAHPGEIAPLADQAVRAALDAGVVLGAALSARAPRLSILLGVKGRPVANISLQRLLLGVALRLTEVRKIVPNPADPDHLLAATWYGLYQSYDGGVSWVRTFAGLTAAERGIYDVVFDPRDPKRVYMGTQRGLFVSNNSGDGWSKSTTVPEIIVKKIAIDPTDSQKIYVGGLGGVFRSSDGLQSVVLSYYSTLPRWNDVFWITIDPNDPDTAYLGTGAGLVKTTNLRNSTAADWQFLKPMRLENLVTPVVHICSKHRGHLYTMTRADLHTINYGANGPESLMLESWNGGEDWRVLASLRSAGDIRWFTVDPRDPDQVWVAFSRAIVRVRRVPEGEARPVTDTGPVLPDKPSLGEVLEASLRYHKLDVGTYQSNLDKLRYGNWLPTRLNLTLFAGRSKAGAVHDDLQFAEERYLAVRPRSEWRIMAFATWRLPDIYYEPKTITMQRVRELMMNDEIRNRIIYGIQRNYGELQRLWARQGAGSKRDLYTRAVDRVRIEQLEALVDLTSGGYLTKHKKRMERTSKGR